MKFSYTVYKNAPIATVCSLIGAIIVGVGAFVVHDTLAIGIVLLVVGFFLMLISNAVAVAERKKVSRYTLNKDGSITCNDCNNIITTIPCPFCQKKSEEHILSLENSIPCKNCGAFVDPNHNVCHVCGEKLSV